MNSWLIATFTINSLLCKRKLYLLWYNLEVKVWQQILSGQEILKRLVYSGRQQLLHLCDKRRLGRWGGGGKNLISETNHEISVLIWIRFSGHMEVHMWQLWLKVEVRNSLSIMPFWSLPRAYCTPFVLLSDDHNDLLPFWWPTSHWLHFLGLKLIWWSLM